MQPKSIGVVAGGIVGHATDYKLQIKFPDLKVAVIGKGPMVGLRQSGRNSGVLHFGLYYETGTFKARLAVDGIRQMTAFCRENEIDHDICGKIVVASTSREVKFLDKLPERGNLNGRKLIMDFRIEKIGRLVHVLNTPSPGATASLATANHILENYITAS